MKKLTFEDIRERGLLIYEYIRGSHAYGLQKPDGTSDIDTAGVYIEPVDQILGLGIDFQEQIEDERHDNVWFSLKKFMNMLLSSNPTVLESLFIPEDKVIYEHPIMTEIKKYRNYFVTKACFKPFLGYGIAQIKKARSLKKMIVNPITNRLGPLDFAYTFFRQGSTKIENWLEHRYLKQKYCGLVNIPNMDMTMGVYYDWGNHFLNECTDYDLLVEGYKYFKEDDTIPLIKERKVIVSKIEDAYKNDTNMISTYETDLVAIDHDIYLTQLGNMVRFICEFYNVSVEDDTFKKWFDSQKPIGYKGMVGEDKLSNELRLSSVSKGEKPICYINYNKDGYSQHCRSYKEYQDWVKFRNPERYKENKEKDFDRKNLSHAVRLMHMGIEIANTGKVNVDRTNIDRDFILKIRLGDSTYEELIAYLDGKMEEMEEAMSNSTLPENIDVEFINNMLVSIRKKYQNFK